MTMTELFLAELEREGATTRRMLERVPDHRTDWKPHERSMPMGYLSTLVATMPGWVCHTVDQDELDLQPLTGEKPTPKTLETSAELVAALDREMARARVTLQNTTDEHLLTNWRLLVAGQVVSEAPRHIVLRDSVFNHLAHHRGQLSVYLRLNEAKVPSIYGPTADEPFPTQG